MNIEELRDYCLIKTNVEETFPFGPDTIVYKVNGKMFLLCGFEHDPLSFNVKCDPEKAIELREHYSCVQPGYHMNKQHWNTIVCDGSVPDKLLKEWIDHSYELISAGSKKSSKGVTKKTVVLKKKPSKKAAAKKKKN